MRAQFITADEVAQVMGIGRSKAYDIVRQMNKELKGQGYITVAGKCPLAYFKQKFYGFQPEGGINHVSAYSRQPRVLAQRHGFIPNFAPGQYRTIQRQRGR